MNLFDNPTYKMVQDMIKHPCMKKGAMIQALSVGIGFKCNFCGKKWMLCDTPLLVQKFVRLDLPIFRKAIDRTVIVIEEEEL